MCLYVCWCKEGRTKKRRYERTIRLGLAESANFPRKWPYCMCYKFVTWRCWDCYVAKVANPYDDDDGENTKRCGTR
jgi:hypothetical protein